ncbi:TIM barrel protein [Cetobacterium sp. ZWU0022]|uniref:TIM barrel protein n=1 Tax=Cetobacterium sp. ZWU0022 TaxID=1340502 RepID=UPI0006476817|nr:TIM barrel protein [Cetobacterium sp. ZWU0022]
MLGLVCMLDGKGMKKGVASLKAFNLEKVREAALFNLDYTLETIRFCRLKGYIYRVSSSVIPYPDCWEWNKDEKVLEKLAQIKKQSSKIRLIIHPDQFVVLNSDSESVIKNSLKILKNQTDFAKLAGISDLVLHIGKKDGIQKFIETFKTLDDYTKSILVLENCHYYKVNEVLELCEKIEIPMVLDVHHARVTKSEEYDIERVKATWKDRKPLAHISSGKESEDDKSHADYISVGDVQRFEWLFQDFDVEVEAKKKELALEKLERDQKS